MRLHDAFAVEPMIEASESGEPRRGTECRRPARELPEAMLGEDPRQAVGGEAVQMLPSVKDTAAFRQMARAASIRSSWGTVTTRCPPGRSTLWISLMVSERYVGSRCSSTS